MKEISKMDIQPRADVIEYKFRTYNGQLQYRRWNATRNYWVDPYWICLLYTSRCV